MNDDASSAIAMANAFRAANVRFLENARARVISLAFLLTFAEQDDDTMQAMNAFSARKLDPLNFYVITSDWMQKAWPLLTLASSSTDTWRSDVGRIENQRLLVDHEVSDDENRPQQRAKPRMRRDAVHERDFLLLGANAWLLLREKFGFDVELPCRCVPMPGYNSVAAIELPVEGPPLTIPIPASGRFAYEHVLSNMASKLQAKAAADAAAAAAAKHMGNVSDDDETAECGGDDLVRINRLLFKHDCSRSHKVFQFPGDEEERMSVDNPASNPNEPILLLPASTTITKNDDYWLEDNSDQVMPSSNSPVLKPYGSGLGNLGNTCFMNSTLQCLTHTDPLRKYFLSGEYERDLNRDNPLGTGGDLAIQFAQLLEEMWGTNDKSYSGYGATTGVVYPRNFKFTLGRHAEQFVGYDQHDSQELATYLLDALHEDTNRVTQKPYVEKSEQGENETDEDAAGKAWELHLKREDSKVLEMFMGLVKSRVQCCKEDCNRVSTTFDPFMYLSVPIPGSSERTLRVTFVPLDSTKRSQEVDVTLSKTATTSVLKVKLLEQLKKLRLVDEDDTVAPEDLCPVDVWQREVYSYFKPMDEVDAIRDNDETYVYQLHPLSDIRRVEQEASGRQAGAMSLIAQELRQKNRPKRYKLDLATMTRINGAEGGWANELLKYLQNEVAFATAFNLNRGKSADRMRWYRRLTTFLDLCYQDAEVDVAGQKRLREDADLAIVLPDEDVVPGIRERCESSQYFKGVSKRHDLAVLEFIASKMRSQIIALEGPQRDAYPDGLVIQVRIRKCDPRSLNPKERSLVAPLVIRIPSNMTVYQFRELMASRLAFALKTGHGTAISASGESTSERASADVGGHLDGSFGSPELLILRQVPLTAEREKSSTTQSRFKPEGVKLGALDRGNDSTDSSRPVSLASPTDAAEKVFVADVAGNHGIVSLDFPEDLADRCFDVSEYEAVDRPSSPFEGDTIAGRTRKATHVVSVLDCIEKYCQMEQLEESEMWYCNRCKEHVRAWKQFHLFKAPPILIVHLKRFQYSAVTHRRDKINLFVDFPLEGLDLTKQVMHWREEEKPIYDCYAVSHHFGGLGGGHYTAHALNSDGTWCYYDDSRVTTNVDPKEVVSASAYVLYYRRKDVPVGEEFALNLQTPGVETPAIIQDPLDKMTDNGDEASSNAAMVDEDEVMDEGNVPSRSTSPMGSLEGVSQYGDDLDAVAKSDDFPPLQ